MATAAARPKQRRQLVLFERLNDTGAAKPKLKVDRDKGIIYRVRIGGRLSKNTHGERGVDGSEYLREAYDEAKPLYEGVKVRVNHPQRDKPKSDRDTNDSFGVIRNPRTEDDDNGEWGFYGDLHYLKAHPLAESVIEDVERGLGVYGLSHHAFPSKESIRGNRLVFERIGKVESVDLVDKPATNRNLWESHQEPTVKYTLRSILESRQAKFSAPRIAWCRRLLEDDGLAAPLAAETGDMPETTDPDEAMKAAFKQAADEILGAMFDGEIDEADGFKKLKDLVKTHGRLTQTAEPEAPEEVEEEEEPKPGEKKDKDKMESLEKENATLKRQAKFRELCEAEQFTPSKMQLKAGVALESADDQRTYIRECKVGQKPGVGGPRSRPVTESQAGAAAKPAAGAVGALSILRRG